MTQENVLDPDNWLTSTYRALVEYVEFNINEYVRGMWDKPRGLDAYQIVFTFPDANVISELIPLPKTLIHFSLDDIDNTTFGMGENMLNWRIEGDQVVDEEGQFHDLMWDVGIWASDKSGGTTALLAAYEMLNYLFHGPSAGDRMEESTQGVQVRSFRGGRFIRELVNDILLHRVIDLELNLRVGSRVLSEPRPVVEEIIQRGAIEFVDEIIVPVA